MGKPSLKEVKRYFSNAKIIQCIYLSEHESEIDMNDIREVDGEYWSTSINSKVNNDINLWDKEKGYAKILTYKNTEPKFEITKEQIKEIKELSLLCKPATTVSKLKEWFPEAFKDKTKLKESLWYKSIDYPKWMLCVTNVNFKEKRVKGYGFGSDGNWMGNADNDSWEFNEFDRCLEMSEQEVFEALKNEAVKRGIKLGGYIVRDFDDNLKNVVINDESFPNDATWFYHHGNDYLEHYGFVVYSKGQWASVIETKTIQEAEELLKELGHNFKIV